MKRFKWLLFMSLVVVMVAALACSSDDDEDDGDAADEGAAVVSDTAVPDTAVPETTTKEDEVMEEDGPKFGGTLKYVPQGSIKFIDTMATGAIVTGTVGRMAYDQLFWRDKDYNIFPQMLDSWSLSEDGKTYTFKVQEGHVFHDGTPLEMVDIAESHNRFARVDPLGRQLLGISAGNADRDASERIFNQTIDEGTNTIVMNFDQPTGMVLEFLAQLDPRQPSIMAESLWSVKVGEPIETAVGTAAFQLVEWVPQEVLKFEKWDQYVPNTGVAWDFTKGEIVQYLDGWEALDIPDHQVRISAIQTGEVDVLDDFTLDLAKQLDGAANVVWSPIRDGNYGVMAFNHDHPPFDMSEAGILAKRAILAATDNARVMLAAVGDDKFYTPCYQVIHCGTPWTTVASQEIQDQRLKTATGDMDKGKELLDQAEALSPGIKDATIRLIAASDMPFMPEAALVTQETMRAMGFTSVELVSLDWASRVALTGQDGPWEMASSWSNFANGLNPLAPHMPSSPSAAGWIDDKVTELRDQFLVEADRAKQQVIYDELTRQIHANPPSTNFFMFSPPRAARDDVKGLCLDCLFPILHNVWLDR